MTTTDTTPDWLALAENEHAERERTRRAEWEEWEEWAADIAKTINVRLEELGITPLTPAGTDGTGKLIPAKLADPDPKQKFHGVYASYNEEDESVTLLVTAQPGYDHTSGVGETGCMLRDIDAAAARRLIVNVRRSGPKRPPSTPEQLSVDTEAIVEALGDVRAALEELTRAVKHH